MREVNFGFWKPHKMQMLNFFLDSESVIPMKIYCCTQCLLETLTIQHGQMNIEVSITVQKIAH